MKRVGARTLAVVVASAVVAACGAASTSPFASPATLTPKVISSPATSPTSAAEPTGAPTSVTLVLGGTWVSPRAGARLSSFTTTLSAKPTATGPGLTTFTKVAFSATWADAQEKVMCTATEPGLDGAWTCKANLLALGVPPGKVTFTFDVHGEGVPAAISPDGSREVTYAVPPPRPTDTALVQVKPPDFENGNNTGTYRVDWSAPAGYADEFLVYATWECPRPSTEANAGTPCFVAGTPVDVSQLELLATATGDVRSVQVGVDETDCEGLLASVLLRARNAYGRSIFAVVHSAPVVWYDPDSSDMIC